MKRLLIVTAVLLSAAGSVRAQEIGFSEDFALARDRAEALKQLIPGTEDHYYYSCLDAQNRGDLDKVDGLLKLWIERYHRTGRVVEIENRQALLRYDKQPGPSLEYIRKQIGLDFNHQRQTEARQVKLATRLDPALISRDTLLKAALSRYGNLQGLEASALDWATAVSLNPDQRRDLLGRLARPDYPNLVQLVSDDLDYRYSGGFGSLNVHRLMLLDQLDALLKLKPALLNDTNFVQAHMARLMPGADVNWQQDRKAQVACLDRLWGFVSRLGPVHNSLKACVLYHRLTLDRAMGAWDRDRFMTYLQLPRPVFYMRPQYLQRKELRDYPANLGADYSRFMRFGPINADEPLVRSYLLHFLVQADGYDDFSECVESGYLKQVFAESKIVNGIGDMEKWYSLMPPSIYQALKDRVDVDFAFTNKELFTPNEPVSLDLFVKNVPKLILKVYQVNALNYYRDNLREVDTDISLDGLVANSEQVFNYADPPLLRRARTFDLPQLKERGVYVVEFIGNGISSRALVRKGQLRFVVRTSTAGQVFTVLDESDKPVPGARLFLAGHEFVADKTGQAAVPMSNNPGSQPIVLADPDGDFATLARFTQTGENYRLSVGFHVDREALVRADTSPHKASVIIRPQLTLNGQPVTLSVLEDVRLQVASTDMNGVQSTKEVPDFKLAENGESTFEFQVPGRLASIAFSLSAKVQNLSQNQKQSLADSASFSLAAIDRTNRTMDLFLLRDGANYALDLLGKSGEPMADRPVQVVLKHRDFRDPVHVTLATDSAGRVALGPLTDIATITATSPEGASHAWTPARDMADLPASIGARVGDAVAVPFMADPDQPLRSQLSLIELRGGQFFADRFDALSVKGGFVVVQDLAAGDYSLLLKDAGQEIAVRLTDGPILDGRVMGAYRVLEQRNPAPLQIVSVTADKDAVKIQLANATKFARVHVIATRFVPEYPLFDDLRMGTPGAAWALRGQPESVYVAGRNIGDEYRYILDRKYAARFPGNMLTRPGLLLNPWSVRKTQTGQQVAAEGEEYGRQGGKSFGSGPGGANRERQAGPAAGGGFSEYDFLRDPAVVLVNLLPDAKGVITIPRKDLGDKQQIRVLAADPENTVLRDIALAAPQADYLDLRLANGLDPAARLTEQKQVSVVAKGGAFTLADVRTSQFEVYDSVARLYRLLTTLSSDPTLAEFSFILDWPKMKDAEKREKYSKYACHELNFFLMHKDPDFFKAVVQPYLKNKKDKTFMDHYLLGDDLSGYRFGWEHQQLNAAEQVLLAQRIDGEAPATARHVRELWELIPPDVERFNRLFGTALAAGSLETADRFGLKELQAAAEPKAGWKAEVARAANGHGATGGAYPAETPALAPPMAPPATSAAPAAKMPMDAQARRDVAKEQMDEKLADDSAGYYAKDRELRSRGRQFYRRLDKTEEWAENNYYHLPIARQNGDLIAVNAFWKDYAAWDGKGPFLSANFAEATGSFAEMMLALAVTDLPFDPADAKTAAKDRSLTLTAGGPMVVFSRQILPAQAAEKTPILVSQDFFRADDRYSYDGNERSDKYVTDEFIVHVVYGCQIVLTNPTSSRQRLDLLVQVPVGSMPVLNGQQTRSVTIELQPFATQKIEYYFYFPRAGTFAHFPVNVARNEKLIAAAPAVTLNVVDTPTKVDTTSWEYVSQNGTEEQVLKYLRDNNVERLDLDLIAWRMADAKFFRTVVALLDGRHVYSHTLWSYAIKHDDPAAARQFLQHCDGFLAQCGPYIDCRLVTIDPVVRHAYEHLEYSPLVNARVDQLGARRRILNDQFHQQYHRLMAILCCRPTLDDSDLLAVTYYMLLQDRVGEGLDYFARVNPDKLATRIQYDYLTAYVDFYKSRPADARAVAARYAEYPVDRWRQLFANVLSQADEIEGKGPQVANPEDRDQVQARLAATEPALDFALDGRTANLTWRNLDEVRVNYYQMDIELLFSRNPFVQSAGGGGDFAYIRPNLSQTVKLQAGKTAQSFELPEKLAGSNVMVEIVAGPIRKTQAYFSNSMKVQLMENYGQLAVTDAAGKAGLSKVYVKVYARTNDGQVIFYKDGYTDLRGRFDYTSLNTNELERVARFSILVLSDTQGAVVREAAPPKQ
ncbi:MAG: hypothetical protein BIFFINMI_04345 [Phycisphaerae bacterium]|nr:hypothetical protein [Phycisphaerae bacterium]